MRSGAGGPDRARQGRGCLYPEFPLGRGAAPRPRGAKLREINKDARLQTIQDVIRDFSVDDILARLEKADVPSAKVLTRTEMRQHPQIAANGTIVETDHPSAGRLRQARHAAVFSKTPASIRRGAPKLGEHTREVLREAT
ncbi:MAG: hypothetical protein EP348_03460 [Alphaproteobacteria bacterium]|nr:MAG: hypothetical protein EP348_03460 [Alphaproteobacteria bacterium]